MTIRTIRPPQNILNCHQYLLPNYRNAAELQRALEKAQGQKIALNAQLNRLKSLVDVCQQLGESIKPSTRKALREAIDQVALWDIVAECLHKTLRNAQANAITRNSQRSHDDVKAAISGLPRIVREAVFQASGPTRAMVSGEDTEGYRTVPVPRVRAGNEYPLGFGER